jgi:hypothetical protein
MNYRPDLMSMIKMRKQNIAMDKGTSKNNLMWFISRRSFCAS